MEFLTDGPEDAAIRVVLAHGAGAAMDTPFLNTVAEGLAARDLRVVRFEFPYMQERRRASSRRGPDRPPVLLQSWQRVIAELGDPGRLIIGGKSMGGRIASMVADEARVAGLVCLGYPFHPPGRPERLRVAHLEELQTPTLVLQGTRDAFGTPEEVAGYPLSEAIRVVWLEDGDHSFKPRKKSAHTLEQHLDRAIDEIDRFATEIVLPSS